MTAAALGWLTLCGSAVAQPDALPAHTRAQETVTDTVADRHSDHYRFETHRLLSDDGRRRYRIQIGIPARRAPPEGHAALYMLDGNAAIDTLTDEDLEFLAKRAPPVLVAVGYDVPTRNDVVSRAYDYTPPVIENGRLVTRPVVRGRVGGGADIFLRFLEERVQPLVGSRAPVNGRRYLWGHSYGGLFALHVLFTKPHAFHEYIAGDPSAWWHDGALIDEWASFDRSRAAGARIAILVGTRPRPSDRPAPHEAVVTTREGRRVDPRRAIEDMADELGRNGAYARYQAFPEYGHGDMIRVSLEYALRVAAQDGTCRPENVPTEPYNRRRSPARNP